MLLPPELGEIDRFVIGSGQGKVWGDLSDFSGHVRSFLAVAWFMFDAEGKRPVHYNRS